MLFVVLSQRRFEFGDAIDQVDLVLVGQAQELLLECCDESVALPFSALGEIRIDRWEFGVTDQCCNSSSF